MRKLGVSVALIAVVGVELLGLTGCSDSRVDAANRNACKQVALALDESHAVLEDVTSSDLDQRVATAVWLSRLEGIGLDTDTELGSTLVDLARSAVDSASHGEAIDFSAFEDVRTTCDALGTHF